MHNRVRQPSLMIIFFIASMMVFSISHSKGGQLFASQDDDRIKIGKRFSELLNQRDSTEIDKLMSVPKYAERVAKIVFESTASQQGFVKGFVGELSSKSLSKQLLIDPIREDISVVYLGMNKRNVPLVRIDYASGGHEYIQLIINRNSQGESLIVDFLFASSGEFSSVAVGNSTKYLLRPSDSILKRLLGGVEPDKALVNDFKKIASLQAVGKLQESYDLIQTFPDELKNQKEIINTAIHLATHLSDELYRTELARLAKHYGNDPKSSFMLLDHYFYEEDWDDAIKAIQKTKQVWGDDGALNMMLAGIYLSAGDDAAAAKAAEHAIQVEPSFEDAYWFVLEFYAKNRRFAQSVEVLSKLETQFAYEFTADPLADDEHYIALSKSEVYLAWLNQ